MTTITTALGEAREWAVLTTGSHLLRANDESRAEETAACGDRTRVVSRVPGGSWEPVYTPDEPLRFAYLCNGELAAGTIEDYASAWEQAHYNGGGISPDLRTWDGAAFTVRIDNLGTDDDDWSRYRLAVGSEEAYVTLDGRA